MKTWRLQFCRNPPLQYHPAQLSCLCILTETELGGGGPGKISAVMQSCKQEPGRYWRHHHITHSSHTEVLVQEILSTEWATQVLGWTKRFLKCSLPSSRIKQGLECTSSQQQRAPDNNHISRQRDILRVKYCQTWNLDRVTHYSEQRFTGRWTVQCGGSMIFRI